MNILNCTEPSLRACEAIQGLKFSFYKILRCFISPADSKALIHYSTFSWIASQARNDEASGYS